MRTDVTSETTNSTRKKKDLIMIFPSAEDPAMIDGLSPIIKINIKTFFTY